MCLGNLLLRSTIELPCVFMVFVLLFEFRYSILLLPTLLVYPSFAGSLILMYALQLRYFAGAQLLSI